MNSYEIGFDSRCTCTLQGIQLALTTVLSLELSYEAFWIGFFNADLLMAGRPMTIVELFAPIPN